MKSDEIEQRADGWRGLFQGREVRVEGGRLFWRRAIKNALSPAAHDVRWLVAELDGVRVYLRDGEILITKRDVNP